MIYQDIFLHYTYTYEPKSRVDELITWFVKFNLDFASFYIFEPDSTGHSYGPDSQEYANKVSSEF